MIEFRNLLPSEIDVRVQQVKQGNKKGPDGKPNVGAILLLYKDARCDMNILDETVGPTNWQRSHEIINGNLFCNVSIFDEEKNQWVSKQDVGTESNTEAEKGQASDSFKRACFNWGIGRELYTAPFTYVVLSDGEYFVGKDGKVKMNNSVKFMVSEIEYDEKKITKLVLIDKAGNVRYMYPGKKKNG